MQNDRCPLALHRDANHGGRFAYLGFVNGRGNIPQIARALITSNNSAKQQLSGFVYHERDMQGMLPKEGQSLHDTMEERFRRGKRALLFSADHHLLDNKPLAVLLVQSPPRKNIWLAAITLAHRIARQTRRAEEGRMRADLSHWIEYGVCRSVNNTTT
jgi:hypothetical protein